MRLVCALVVLCFTWGSAHAGNETDALTAPAQAVDAQPDSPDAYDAFAQAAFRLHRWDDAIARLKLGVARIPSYHAGWYKLGYAYRQKRDFTDAADAYRKFAELEPTRADTYFGLGAALEGAGDRRGAIDAYARYVSLETAPGKQKFVEQAKGEIEKLRAAQPTPVARAPVIVASPPPAPVAPAPVAPPLTPPPAANAGALRAQAEHLRQAGKLADAAGAYESAVAADPGNLDLYIELGDVYFSQHRYKDAARAFHTTIERDAGYALGWYNLAHADSRAGDNTAAVGAYREYIRLRPSDPDPYYGLGLAYKALGDQRNALDALHTYLKMEKRPESQRWVDKARQTVEELENGPHARLHDLKNPFEDHDEYASDDLLPPGGEVPQATDDSMRRELARDDILPIVIDDDSNGGVSSDEDLPATTGRDRLVRYGNALAAYRAALDRQASELALTYQRGAERLIANDLRGAQRAWTAAAESDRAVADARARLDKARASLQAPAAPAAPPPAKKAQR